MGGPRVAPEMLKRAAEVYERTGYISEASRATGIAEETLRDAFNRLRIARNRSAHAKACEAGLRRARKRLDALGALVGGFIAENAGSIEPRDLAAVLNAAAKLSDSLGAIAEREDRRRSGKLAREKTRAEIAVLRGRIEGSLPADRIEVTHDARDELAARLARYTRPEGPGGAGEGDPPPSTG